MTETRFVSVYLLDVPFHADIAYTYAVPPTFSNVEKGVLVAVPYGKQNRRMTAAVVEEAAAPTLETIKPILEVVSSEPLFDERAIRLCFFLKEHTLCTFGDAFRAMVPSAAISKTKEYYEVSSETPDVETIAPELRPYFERVAREGRVYRRDIESREDDTPGKCLAKLVRQGFLVRGSESSLGGSNRKYVSYYSLAKSAEETEALLAPETPWRSRAQREVLQALYDAGRRLSATELFAMSRENATTIQVKALVKKGLLLEEREEVYRNPFETSGVSSPRARLTDEQEAAFHSLCALSDTREAKAALLYGVTGSGKTAVIRATIEHVLDSGRGVIVLVPEISLTPQTVGIFVGCFGNRVAVIHSSLSQGERYDAFRRIREGQASVVIGTRSAIFAPVPNLGMIVIDEEQEHTYKSDTDPKYQTQDVAAFRCKEFGALLLLASATPSVTSYYKAKSGVYSLLELKERYGGAKLPDVTVVDMKEELKRGNATSLSSTLRDRLLTCAENAQQAIVFLNRRGYHSLLSCRNCGETILCPKCSVSLTYHTRYAVERSEEEDYLSSHKRAGHLICHYCGFQSPVPDQCPACGNGKLAFLGTGTQRAEEELKALLPESQIVRMDMDTTSGKFSHDEILEGFREGKSDVLLGTQMVTKGHDFPKVTLVGVVNADASLHQDDFRATERTFDMITQVIGRAGRGRDPGEAVVQTMNPGNDVIALAAAQDYAGFYEREIAIRRKLVYPPFCDIAVLTATSGDEVLLNKTCVALLERLKSFLSSKEHADVPMVIFGPFEAPVYKVQNRFRMRLVIKCKLTKKSRKLFAELLSEFGRTNSKKLTLGVDFNPSSV